MWLNGRKFTYNCYYAVPWMGVNYSQNVLKRQLVLTKMWLHGGCDYRRGAYKGGMTVVVGKSVNLEYQSRYSGLIPYLIRLGLCIHVVIYVISKQLISRIGYHILKNIISWPLTSLCPDVYMLTSFFNASLSVC